MMDMTGFEAIFDMFEISATTTAALAGVILSILASLKRFIPKIDGNISLIIAGTMSILLSMKAYWFPTPNVFSIIASSIFVFGFATGAFELLKLPGKQIAKSLNGNTTNTAPGGKG